MIEGHETHPAADVFPLLEGEEFERLVADIKANGLREPLWRTWVDDGLGNGTRKALLLDGRNRLRACAAARVTPDWRDYEGDDPVGFVVSLNLHRRHLNESQRAMVAAKVSNLSPGRPSEEKGQIRPVSIASAAKQLTVGERTVKDARAVLDRGTPELVQAVERGELAVSAAAEVARMPEERQRQVLERADLSRAGNVRAVVRQVEKAEVAAKLNAEPVPLPDGQFRVIVADPPWAYEKREGDVSHRGDLPYPSMSIEAICALDVGSRAHEDAVLWLWTTNAFMRDAYRVLDAWGFAEKTILTWAKTQIGLGDWLRGQTEHAILAVRGKPTITLTNQTTLLTAPRREHSRKPVAFYELVEALCPGSKLEVFGREGREGWVTWGAEADKFSEAV